MNLTAKKVCSVVLYEKICKNVYNYRINRITEIIAEFLNHQFLPLQIDKKSVFLKNRYPGNGKKENHDTKTGL